MSKNKIAFVCTDCGTEHGQWQGQCASCKEWNTLSQINLGNSSSTSPATKADFRKQGYSGDKSNVQNLSDIDLEALPRFSSSIDEMDRVLGGGLVPGSAILIGGNPGAGKSTLLLQIMCLLANTGKPALYVTGEESLQQVGMRAKRLNLPQKNLKMLAETNVEQICKAAQEHQPQLLVVDSIQVMHSATWRRHQAVSLRCASAPPILFSMRSRPTRFYFWLVT